MQEIKIQENKNEHIKQKINFFLVKYFRLLKISLFLIILLLGLFLIVKPKYVKAIKGIEQLREQNQAKYDILQGHLSKLNKLNEVYEKINPSNVEKINSMLPNSLFYEDLFSHMDSIISKRGLFLQSMEINSEKEKEIQKKKAPIINKEDGGTQRELPAGIIKISLNLNILGVDYVGLKGLLHDFENNMHLLDIVNLNFSPVNQSVSFMVDTYYMENDN